MQVERHSVCCSNICSPKPGWHALSGIDVNADTCWACKLLHPASAPRWRVCLSALPINFWELAAYQAGFTPETAPPDRSPVGCMGSRNHPKISCAGALPHIKHTAVANSGADPRAVAVPYTVRSVLSPSIIMSDTRPAKVHLTIRIAVSSCIVPGRGQHPKLSVTADVCCDVNSSVLLMAS